MENELTKENINKLVAGNLVQSYVILAKDALLNNPRKVLPAPLTDEQLKPIIFDAYQYFLSRLDKSV